MLKKAWGWLNDRLGLEPVYQLLLRHPIPPKSAGKHGWMYIFGTAVLTVFLLQVATGVALTLAYIPSTQSAYDSLQFITNDAFGGNLVRGAHYFGASAMVVLLGFHIGRVILTGSYKFPREMNWLTGVVLLLLVFVMAFTGQLLRWDEDAIGSTLVAAEQAGRLPIIGEPLARLILGGKTIGGATLTRFYAIHVFLIPALIFGSIGVHLMLVIRHGVSEPPEAGKEVDPKTYREEYETLVRKGNRFYFPDALWREVAFAAAVVAVIFLLAVFVGPKHLGGPPDPTNTESNPRPDWYFIWLFALFAVIPPAIENVLIVIAPPIVVFLLLSVPFIGRRGERSPFRRPWAVGFVILAGLGILSLIYTGIDSPWAPRFNQTQVSASELNLTTNSSIQGSELFLKAGCQYCHGIAGKGGTKGPDLTRVASRMGPDQIKARILVGPEGMPSFAGSLSDQEIQTLVDFLTAVNASEAKK
jgi:ubiquinol-cytochrome c reductase cytochrome b subunit